MVDEDRRRFERLFHEHYDAVLAYAVVRTDIDAAKDAVAQAFLVAWRRRVDIPEHTLPWLLGVTRKTLAEQRRAKARRDNLFTRVRGSAREAFHVRDPAEQVADLDAAMAAFLSLRERDREVLRLVTWDRLGRADAAQVLGCSPAAFAVRLSRARRRFADALASCEAAEPTGSVGEADPLELFCEPLEAQ